MKKNDTEEISAEKDQEFVRNLLKQQKLAPELAKLDPNDLHGSIQRVPVEMVRFLWVLTQSEISKEQLAEFAAEDRELIESLQLSLKNHENARTFFGLLGPKLEKDAKIQEVLGISGLQSSSEKNERQGKLQNTITSITGTPQLMLKANTVYCEIGFWRGEELLLSSKFEFVALLAASRSLLTHARETLSLATNIPSATESIKVKPCQDELKTLKDLFADLEKGLSDLRPEKARLQSESKMDK
jgi:hypothetical protein